MKFSRFEPSNARNNEGKMINLIYTFEDMKKLPLRAVVAFAARCALRVEHLALLPDDHPESASYRSAVRAAVGLAEDFARGLPCTACDAVVRNIEAARSHARGELARELAMGAVIQAAHSAVTGLHTLDIQDDPGEWRLSSRPERGILPHLADLSADNTAIEAFTAAVEASDAARYSDEFVQAAIADFEKLKSLNLGRYPDAGQPIDPSPTGPLGPLRRTERLR
jgi:hypothetical protein